MVSFSYPRLVPTLMKRFTLVRPFIWAWVALASPAITLICDDVPSLAQVVPDETLGSESSQVLTDVEVKGEVADLIQGGASRGANLFHSFIDFNVEDLQRVYFANPVGIDSILSRVTGPDASNISGTLGVDGSADLFFINPNGIVFGENAALDIEGSFYGTTGEAIALGQNVFSATQPEQSRLVSVHPDVSFESYLSEAAGDITNRGQLAASEDLVLAARQLDLQGQIASGNNLTLLALDELKISDTATMPFVASSGGELLIQGNEQINIFALNHPDSVLYSFGGMTLRSDNTVSGDAHYWSNGNFRVENLSGELAGLSSPNDPIVRSAGNVFIGDYIGNSLHIIAGGAISISGTIRVTGADDTGASIQEVVALSNGETVSVDGSRVATLDIRAGVLPEKIGTPLGLVGDGSFPTGGQNDNFPFSASILIGNIILEGPNRLVLLTNQYFPNELLMPSDIIILGQNFLGEDATLPISGIDASGLNDLGGQVLIDSRGGILLDDNVEITTDSAFEDAGDVYLLAEGDIILDPDAAISANSETAEGGNIHLSAGGSILLGESTTITTDSVFGDAGNVDLLAERDILLALGAAVGTISETAKAGDIHLSADEIELSNANPIVTAGADGNILVEGNKLSLQFLSFILSSANGTEDGGNVSILMNESIEVVGGGIGTLNTSDSAGDSGNVLIRTGTLDLQGSLDLLREGAPPGGDISSDISGTGDAGDILIEADQVSISNGGQIRARLLNTDDIAEPAQGGNITLIVSGALEVDGFIEEDAASISKISTTTSPRSTGNGGNLRIEAGSVLVRDGAQIQAGTFGSGQGGDILIKATESIILFDDVDDDRPTGVFAGPERSQTAGNGGDIELYSDLIAVIGTEALISNGVDIDASGDAGNISLFTQRLRIEDGGLVSTGTQGTGDAGDILIKATDSVTILDALLATATLAAGDGGNLSIDTRRLLADNSVIAASTTASGNAGSISINASDSFTLDGTAVTVSTEGEGNAGNLSLSSDFVVLQTSRLATASQQSGSAGAIQIDFSKFLLLNDSQITTSAPRSTGGNIFVNSGSPLGSGIIGLVSSDITTDSNGDGGNINLNSLTIAFGDSDIIARSESKRGGNITFGPFFSQTLPPDTTEPFDGDGKVDVNADGLIAAGQIFTPDTSFIENSLSELSEALVNTESLTVGSCIDRSRTGAENRSGGSSFTVTGGGAIPQQPGSSSLSRYSTGTVQATPEVGQTIQEPQNVYQLADGRWVLSHDCQF